MITLYDFPLSGHAHRARLMLSLLGLEHRIETVDLGGGEQKSEHFLSLNPFGVVPVLVDGDFVLRESTAILVYLARSYAPEWYPIEPRAQAEVQSWLATATRDIPAGPGAARLVTVFGAKLDHAALIEQSHRLLRTLDAHLESRDWLALQRPTVADVAAYAYVARAPEGGVSLADYPAVQRWLANVEALPGFLPMPAANLPAAA